MSTETDLKCAWREKREGFAAAADMIGKLLDSWQEQCAEIDALRALLLAALACAEGM